MKKMKKKAIRKALLRFQEVLTMKMMAVVADVHTVPKRIRASNLEKSGGATEISSWNLQLLVASAIFLLAVCAIVTTGALAQAGRARLFGRLSNGEGEPIPNAVVVVCNADAGLWFITSTDAQGMFELGELPANRFAIEVLSPQWRRRTRNPGRDQVWGFSPWSDTVALQAGQTLQRNIQLGGLTLQPRTAQTLPPCIPRRSFSVLSVDGLARLFIDGTTPVYPQSAQTANIEGEVDLEAFMNKDGKVISLRLLVPSWPPKIDPILTKAAVDAVRSWRYSPPGLNSQQERFEFGGQIVVNFARDR
jgi:TonB family protein